MNVMRNQNGVTVGIVATTQGVELTFGDASVCSRGFRFKFPMGVGHLDFDLF